MKNSPYQQYKETELSLRDQLAIDRTILANERTLLAYLRSGLALLVTGATLIEFLETPSYRPLGYVAASAGCLTLLWGLVSFFRTRIRYSILRK